MTLMQSFNHTQTVFETDSLLELIFHTLTHIFPQQKGDV